MTLEVIDFFCGSGGFSEGFRQQGFKIIKGIDNWNPAIQTHNLNHGLDDRVSDVLDFEKSIDSINKLKNTEIIIGSPPCVTFSMSNRAGKADKSLGVRLIEAYLRVVAVKKHQPKSILKAWLMENVPNSRNFVREFYTFDDLDLGDWAKTIGKESGDIALRVKNNGGFFIAADYGSPQSRERFICGEIVRTGDFPEPQITHSKKSDIFNHQVYKTLGEIKRFMPSPFEFLIDGEWKDPNYPGLILIGNTLTDHFYDTGLYQVEWEKAKFAKVNHPYMGKMSFPEDENKPSRTIMATRSASTREAIIFKSEYSRNGDGEYRLPTIREIATLMGFPYNYQFFGSEGTKWRLIGNAVCPHMSAALAKAIRRDLGLGVIEEKEVDFTSLNENHEKVNNLNSPTKKTQFNAPPKKNIGAKFRMHPFKSGNMTVALTNFDPINGSNPHTNGKNWFCVLYLGSGKIYDAIPVSKTLFRDVEKIVSSFSEFEQIKNEFSDKIINNVGSFDDLQYVFEKNVGEIDRVGNPVKIIENVSEIINNCLFKIDETCTIRLDGIKKTNFHKKQLLAIWMISQIVYSNNPSRIKNNKKIVQPSII